VLERMWEEGGEKTRKEGRKKAMKGEKDTL
jgi:hypothetical protein